MPGYQYSGARKNEPTIILPNDHRRHPSNGRLIARCGTDAGYHRHVSNNEYACDACLEAHRRHVTPNPSGIRRVKGDPIAHGTNRGYKQHWREGSRPCLACCDAHAAYQRERKAAA